MYETKKPSKLIYGKTLEIIPSFGPPLGKCKTWKKYDKMNPPLGNAEIKYQQSV